MSDTITDQLVALTQDLATLLRHHRTLVLKEAFIVAVQVEASVATRDEQHTAAEISRRIWALMQKETHD
jgi:hypothetical protein